MSKFSEMLDAMNVPAGQAVELQVPLPALHGSPRRLSASETPVTIKVLRHQATKMAARKPPQPAAASVAAKAPAKRAASFVRIQEPQPLFGQKPRKNPRPARTAWSAAAITSNVPRAT